MLHFSPQNRMSYTRILALKSIAIPIWLFSTSALYRMIYSQQFQDTGFLWLSDFTLPDHLYILPCCFGFLFFQGIFGDRWFFKNTEHIPISLFSTHILIRIFYISFLIRAPAIISYYWILITLTMAIKNILLRLSWTKLSRLYMPSFKLIFTNTLNNRASFLRQKNEPF